MFYTPKEKDKLTNRMNELEDMIWRLNSRVTRLEDSIHALLKTSINKAKAESEAPHGLKKDGTPKAKPGRKTK